MKQYNVSLVINVPDVGATDEQIEEWCKFQTGYRSEISIDNPLESHDMEADWIEVKPLIRHGND